MQTNRLTELLAVKAENEVLRKRCLELTSRRDKSLVGGFYDAELKTRVKAIAKERGISLRACITNLLIEGLLEEGVSMEREVILNHYQGTLPFHLQLLLK